MGGQRGPGAHLSVAGRAHHRAGSHVCATVAEQGEDAPGHLNGTGNTDRRELCCGHWAGVYLSGIVLTLGNHLQKAHNSRPRALRISARACPAQVAPTSSPFAALGANRS